MNKETKHPTWELVVDNGALILTPCPGTKGVDLQQSLQQLKEQGVTTIVTAISDAEMANAHVATLALEAQKLGLTWYHHPIEDDHAPTDDFHQHWKISSPSLHQSLDNAEKIALHCMGGSGRTGLLAFHVLFERQWPLDKITQQVQLLRPGAFTKPLQIQYVRQFANQ